MGKIEVTINTEAICSCNGCNARNFDSFITHPGEKVDLLFKVRIGCQVSCLCKSCLNELIGAAVTINAEAETK